MSKHEFEIREESCAKREDKKQLHRKRMRSKVLRDEIWTDHASNQNRRGKTVRQEIIGMKEEFNIDQ